MTDNFNITLSVNLCPIKSRIYIFCGHIILNWIPTNTQLYLCCDIYNLYKLDWLCG